MGFRVSGLGFRVSESYYKGLARCYPGFRLYRKLEARKPVGIPSNNIALCNTPSNLCRMQGQHVGKDMGTPTQVSCATGLS